MADFFYFYFFCNLQTTDIPNRNIIETRLNRFPMFTKIIQMVLARFDRNTDRMEA